MGFHDVATKYRRRGLGEVRDDFHSRVINFSARKPISPQKKLLIIYSGLGLAALFLFVFHIVSQYVLFAWEPAQSGEGIVLEKWTEDLESGPAYWVRVEAEVETESETRTLIGEALLDIDSWAALQKGDRVDLTLRAHQSRPAMRVESIAREAAAAAP